jgi:hypothetical protein
MIEGEIKVGDLLVRRPANEEPYEVVRIIGKLIKIRHGSLDWTMYEADLRDSYDRIPAGWNKITDDPESLPGEEAGKVIVIFRDGGIIMISPKVLRDSHEIVVGEFWRHVPPDWFPLPGGEP